MRILEDEKENEERERERNRVWQKGEIEIRDREKGDYFTSSTARNRVVSSSYVGTSLRLQSRTLARTLHANLA